MAETTEATDIGLVITRTPGIRAGRHCIAGTGVSVHRIAVWYKQGYTPEEIKYEIEHLSLAQVYAALAYYHAHREAIDAKLAQDEAEADRLEAEHRAAAL